MKKCNICYKTYTDDSLNFCLNDGGTLEKTSDGSAPTVFMNQTRTTSETNWSNNSAFTPPNNQPMSNWQQNQPVAPNPSYLSSSPYQSPNQTLPVVSLILGVISVSFCCYGFPFGIGALITGFLGYNNVNKDPNQYGGRTMAIAGMILGAISIVILLVFVLIGILGNVK